MRFDRLDLNLLVALDVLIAERNVSAAAKRLNLSQPALTGALNRLREFFKDDILVQAGRGMVPTPRAEELAAPVREALMLIRSKITTPSEFDPATAVRDFVIVASDFAFNVLLATALADASQKAPNITFEILSTDRLAVERMERGEADLVLTIGDYLSKDHPRKPLFQDEHAVICCSDGPYRAGIDTKGFFEAGHAIAYFGSEKHPAFTETYFAQKQRDRRVELRVPNFAALPQSVVGSNRVATMYRRHAEHFARLLPITVLDMPFEMPIISEEVQWNAMRGDDKGLQWLLGLLFAHSDRLPPVRTAGR